MGDNASGSEDDEDAHDVFSPSSVNAGLSVKLLLLQPNAFSSALCYVLLQY
jgi:hypothetical protein